MWTTSSNVTSGQVNSQYSYNLIAGSMDSRLIEGCLIVQNQENLCLDSVLLK